MTLSPDILRFGNLTLEQSMPFWPAMLLMGLSLWLFLSGRRRLGLTALVIGSMAMGTAMALLDPFLGMWDEQYHALVAKHLALDPLRPILVEHTVFGFDYRNWVFNHIWLHKQPLFLWQMALSIHLFGADVMAARLPSIVMHALIPLFIYRMGALAVNPIAGFMAAFLFAMASFPLELIVGAHPTDHNDVAFLFYVTASMWAWCEFIRNRALRWAMAVGFLAGCAILVKWLAGLLVFGMWGLAALWRIKDRERPVPTFGPMLVALAVCVAVALPWQVYIHWAFPLEAAHEYAMMHKHLSEAVEEHAGDWTFHFDLGIKTLYGGGQAVPWLLVLGLLVLVLRTDDRGLRLALGGAVVSVYGFYTLATTKMIAFPLIVAPVLFLGLGALADGFFTLLRPYMGRQSHLALSVVALAAMGVLFLDMNQTAIRHSAHHKGQVNEYRQKRLAAVRLADTLEKVLPPRPHVIFNAAVDFGGHIHLMFHSHHVAFEQIPTPEELNLVRQMLPDHPIVVMDKGRPLPAHVMETEGVKVVRWYWNR